MGALGRKRKPNPNEKCGDCSGPPGIYPVLVGVGKQKQTKWVCWNCWSDPPTAERHAIRAEDILMPSPDPINAYLSWVVHAIQGYMAEADHVMREPRDAIYMVARDLVRDRTLFGWRPLYRGVLLNPNSVDGNGEVCADPRLTFLSFTECLAVATWFGCERSEMSSFVHSIAPDRVGYIAGHIITDPDDVLYHHSWRAFEISGRLVPLNAMARMHPMVQDPAQFDWNLATQKEVILKPIARLKVRPTGVVDHLALDARFLPPHMYRRTHG